MLKRKKVKPITLCDVTIIDDGKLRRAIIVASLGDAVGRFDFGICGLVAYALGKVFSPGADPSVQMVATLATSSVPFLVRLLDGLLFGMLGDKYDRQKIPATTIVVMSISTFCIGLIPSYDTIGIQAPILLLTCKMTQGFSAGSEYAEASIFIAGYSPNRKRGFMGSWLDFDSIAGLVLGTGVAVLVPTIVGEVSFLDWGWRTPLFTTLPLGIIGLCPHHALGEAPAFQQHVDKLGRGDREGLQDDPKVSFKEIATKHWRSLLTYTGSIIITSTTYYMSLTYMPNYLLHNLHYSENRGVLITIAITIGILSVQPVMGLLSDRFDRRPSVLLGSAALFMLTTSAFVLINSNVVGPISAGLLILTAALNRFTGVMASTLPAMFSTYIRYSALAVAFNILMLVAGLTPTLATWLTESSQSLMVPAYYLMVVAMIGLTTGVTMKETTNRPLKGTAPAASNIQEVKETLVEHCDNIKQKIDNIDHGIVDLQAKRTRLVQQHPRIDE